MLVSSPVIKPVSPSTLTQGIESATNVENDNSVNNATEWRVQTNNDDVLYVEFADGYFQDWRD
jgi:hypothetical protein